MSSFPIYYLSYDRFPAPKGAAVHIDAFARGLATAFGGVRLITVQGQTAQNASDQRQNQSRTQGSVRTDERGHPAEDNSVIKQQYCPGVQHVAICVHGGNLIQRTLDFRRKLAGLWPPSSPPIVHFRSIFEGYPIARAKSAQGSQIVYEVNGLPSVELKYHYPQVADDVELLRKLRAQEQCCLDRADLVIAVSDVNAQCLIRRGVAKERIRVIPNGVDTQRFHYQSPREPGGTFQVLYVGTLASWQGVDTAVEAVGLYCRDHAAKLTIVGEGRRRQVDRLLRLATRLGISRQVTILPAQSQDRLAHLYHASDVAVAPLQPNDRNLVQGCCPLKILEAMASGTPLIASDMPVAGALARDGVDALLVRPGSAKALKDAMLRLRFDPGLARRLSASARRRVKQHLTWHQAQRSLVAAYQEVLGVSSLSAATRSAASRSG